MKLKINLLIIIALICAFTTFGQTTNKPTKKPSKIEAELMQLERDIGEANIKRDKAFFARIEADECIFTDSGGSLTTKAEDLASLDQPEGETKLVSYIVDEMKVFDYGKTAVVFGRVTTTTRGKDGEVTRKSRFTDVFVKRNGRWQIVAGHSSRSRENSCHKNTLCGVF